MSSEDLQDLRSLFVANQAVVCAEQGLVRQHLHHPSCKGSATESIWLGILRNYLPRRYGIESAFLIDHTGCKSDQIDVVVYDAQYSPFILKRDNILFIPAESAYAVFEVKQSVDKANLEYAAEKAASVRRLQRTSVRIQSANGVATPKNPFHVVGGILTTTSQWNPPLGPKFETQVLELAKSNEYRIDLGCILDYGAFELDGTSKDKPQLKYSKPDAGLMWFLLRLFHVLQQMGTVPAIDVGKYSACLDK
ncbi:MAG: hypothetical protein HYV27_06050 [Candidatus Hydrogenedentes bacterium]|nr:hypothetical protein [Candidatus Hydrogenedentota bacterium]